MPAVFEIQLGDITKYKVDAIVNAARESLTGGGGVDGAIHAAAGPDLLAECLTIGDCPTGEARITKGYNLPCRHVIHAVGPRVRGYEPTDEDKELLRSAYHSALVLANENECATVAFSSISTGNFSFDPKLAAPIAIDEILSFLNSPENKNIQKVIMVCFYEDIKDIFFKALQKHNNPGNPKKKEKPDSDSQIVAFYRFLARDNKGRLLSDIWDFSPLRLQFQHDFIQWLFPTQEPSAHNKHAPILTKQDIAAIRADRNIQTNMLISFQLMLEFYGFTVNISDNPTIVVSEDFYRCSKRWLKKRNHNFLRITRIIKSLRCFGLDRYAMAFQDVLEEIAEETDVISDETLSHWLDA